MAGGQDKILWSLSLEGADDVSKKLKAAGDVGDAQAKRLKQSFSEVGKGSSGYGNFAQLAEGEAAARRFRDTLRETLHTVHPILDETGLGISNLGVFARLAGTNLGALATAIVGSVVVGLAKLGDEAQKSKLHLDALGASGETFDKLNDRAKKLGISTSALLPGIEQYRAAVNATDADLNRTVIHPPGYKPNETEPNDVRIIGGGKETGARVPTDTFLTAHSALIESGQSEKVSGDEAAKQADAFEKKLLENRQLTADSVRELSPSAANNLAHALAPFFATSLKDGAALVAQLDRPGAHLPTDNEVFRSLAASEPNIAKQAEAAKGVVAGFEAVAAASKRLAESMAGDGTTIGKQLTGTAKDIDKLASSSLQGEMKKALAEAFGAPGTSPNQHASEELGATAGQITDLGKAAHDAAAELRGIKSPNERVAEEFDQLKPKSASGTGAAVAASAIDRALDLKLATDKASEAAVAAAAGAPPASANAPTASSPAAAPGAAPTSGPTVPKFNDGSPNPYGGQPINRPDGYSNALGEAPRNEAERRQQIIESAKISAQENANQERFNQTIRDQNGGNHPTGDRDNYAPPVLGHYDSGSQGFVANHRQPPLDPNAVPGAPQETTFPVYQKQLIKEFHDKYGPSGNPGGVENPTVPKGLFVPGINPDGDPYGRQQATPDVNPAPGRNPGDAPLKKVFIGPEPIAPPDVNGPRSEAAEPAQPQVANLSGQIESLIQGLSNALNGAKDDLNQGGKPVDNLGIRGENQAPLDTAATNSKVADLGAAAEEAAAKLRGVEAPAQAPANAPAAGEQPVVHADSGGHVRGPGTSTSDSIPAMLSDKEYVIKASSVEKIGVDRLDQLNQNPEHFADGGEVRRLADGGLTTDGLPAAIDTADGPQYQVTADPDTGGAYINGNFYPANSPTLQIPWVKQKITESAAPTKQSGQKKKHHSIFAPDNNGAGYALGGLVGHFSDGGSVAPSSPVTRLQQYISSHFANGGMIEAPFAHLALGGMPEMPSANLDKMPIQNSGTGTGPLHPVTLNLPGGGSIDGFHAKPSAVAELRAEANRAKRFSTGTKPNWYGGGGG
jgi:hypothetical protein